MSPSTPREDVGKISEWKAQALFGPTAEVCVGLAKAVEDGEAQSGQAWQR